MAPDRLPAGNTLSRPRAPPPVHSCASGLVMAGGRGSRMGAGEKLLAPHGGRESVLRVADALAGSGRIGRVLAAVSDHAPRARALLESRGVETIGTPGRGYPRDMAEALSRIELPAMVVPGDMPLMDAGAVRQILDACDPSAAWTSVVCDAEFAEKLSSELGPPAPGGRVYSGISVVGARVPEGKTAAETLLVYNDARAALNLNCPPDLGLLCASRGGAADAGGRAGRP